MFTQARIKLTLWYLIIVIAISTSFSFFLYRLVMGEVKRSLRLHTLKLIPGRQYPFSPNGPQYYIPTINPADVVDLEIYEELRKRIILQLALINIGIASLSTILGYFLAGKTLAPIEQMVEDQKRFVSDASHELRTPLTAMKTEIEVALREKNISSREAKELLASNLEEVDRLQKLTNYLLNLNKYQDKTLKLPMENVDLKEIINQSIEHVEPVRKEKDIAIMEKTKSIRIHGNPVSLGELVTILLDNAVKYSKRHSEIKIHTELHKKHVVLEIEDFGIGIKSGEIPYIFNRFYRADTSRNKTHVVGYGLGLSIAKQIADLHKGSIDVVSELTKGSTFRVTLPL